MELTADCSGIVRYNGKERGGLGMEGIGKVVRRFLR
jgi:hypothetical protein